ncbi:MAG: hypothetical protein WA133_11800 [Syntrophales bacterium]
MKRLTALLLAEVIALSIVITPVFADMSEEKGGMMGGGMMMEQGKMMMKDHQGMCQDAMGILKETMIILKNMNHTPSAEQKKKLEEMITKIDGIMRKHEDMMKYRKERREKMEKKGGY